MTNVPLDCIATQINAKEAAAFKLFDKVFRMYSPTKIILSFNGGKDCTVILYMLNKYYQNNPKLKDQPLQVLYIQSSNPFEEIEEFVQQCKNNYKIELIQRKGDVKSALVSVCEEYPELVIVFMGNRRTDPYCRKMKTVQETDDDWPPLMRVNPILDWSVRDVWHYIFVNKVPYCSLYDMGYTSLGNQTNTKPNPHLKVVDETTGEISYRPAYELLDDDSLERAGRT